MSAQQDVLDCFKEPQPFDSEWVADVALKIVKSAIDDMNMYNQSCEEMASRTVKVLDKFKGFIVESVSAMDLQDEKKHVDEAVRIAGSVDQYVDLVQAAAQREKQVIETEGNPEFDEGYPRSEDKTNARNQGLNLLGHNIQQIEQSTLESSMKHALQTIANDVPERAQSATLASEPVQPQAPRVGRGGLQSQPFDRGHRG